MLRILLTWLIVMALVLSGLGIPSTAGAPDRQSGTPVLRLQRGTFDAGQPAPAAPQSPWWEAAPGSYKIVQFNAPPSAADRQRLVATGVQIREYLPDYAYLVQGKAAQLDAAARVPNIYAVTPFVLADKLSPAVLSAIQRGESIAGNFRITGWPGEEAALARDLPALNVTRGTVINRGCFAADRSLALCALDRICDTAASAQRLCAHHHAGRSRVGQLRLVRIESADRRGGLRSGYR
jgi:hypothetical protein